jgi:hypothetical protein
MGSFLGIKGVKNRQLLSFRSCASWTHLVFKPDLIPFADALQSTAKITSIRCTIFDT